jgi:hypothetical protein
MASFFNAHLQTLATDSVRRKLARQGTARVEKEINNAIDRQPQSNRYSLAKATLP